MLGCRCVQPEEQGCFRTHKIQSRDGNPPLHVRSLVVTEDTLQQRRRDLETWSQRPGAAFGKRGRTHQGAGVKAARPGGGGARGLGRAFGRLLLRTVSSVGAESQAHRGRRDPSRHPVLIVIIVGCTARL